MWSALYALTAWCTTTSAVEHIVRIDGGTGSAPIDKEVVSHMANVESIEYTVTLNLDLQREIDSQRAEIINWKHKLYDIIDQIESTSAALLTEHFLKG